jgi:hypothetical protein
VILKIYKLQYALFLPNQTFFAPTKMNLEERRQARRRKNNLEEVKVAGDLGSGVLEWNELVEGHYHELVLLLLPLWLCKGDGMRGDAATGSGQGGIKAGTARRTGEVGAVRQRRERPKEEEVVVQMEMDGGRHGRRRSRCSRPGDISPIPNCGGVFSPCSSPSLHLFSLINFFFC